MKRFILPTVLAAAVFPAFAGEVTREEIRRVSVPGSDTMVVVVSRLTVPVGATIPLHTHFGDEHTVVVTSSRAQTPDGRIVEFPIGVTLYFPAGRPHGGLTNVGDGPMVAVTVSVVASDKPFATPVE